MDQPANGQPRGSFPGTDIVIEHLAKLADRISGPYQARVITTGPVPRLHVVSQLDPDRSEDVLCDFSTDPPDYLTAAGHRLGLARGPHHACERHRQHVIGGPHVAGCRSRSSRFTPGSGPVNRAPLPAWPGRLTLSSRRKAGLMAGGGEHD